MQNKLNDFIKTEILQSGYGLSYNNLDEDPLDELITIAEEVKVGLQSKSGQTDLSEVIRLYHDMKTLVSVAQKYEDFGGIWDKFWGISKDIGAIVHIEYYDPDTTYEEDIMARFNAIRDYLQGAL